MIAVLRNACLPYATGLCLVFLSITALALSPADFEYLPTQNYQSLDDALQAGEWQRQEGTRSLGVGVSPHWLRWTVPNDNSDVLVIHNARLDDFEVFFVHAGKPTTSYHTGGAHAVASRPIALPEFAFPIPKSPRPDHVYVRHNSTSSVLYPLEFIGRDELMQQSAEIHAWHGMYYGIGFIMLVYNLVIYRSVRDKAYLYFVAYAACLMALLASSDGFGQLYLWPDAPQVQVLLPAVFITLLLIFIGQFCIHFLRTGEHAPKLTRAVHVLQICVALNAALVITLDLAFSAILFEILVIAFAVLLLGIAFIRALKRDTAAQIFLAANGVMALAAIMICLTNLGWIQATSLGHHALWLASVIEISMLSLALAWSLQQQREAQGLLQNRSETLERRVRELQVATGLAEEHRQLQKSMQQAQKLKTIGQMTGGFAHDFNNILATILGFSELAIDNAQHHDKQKQTRYLEEIRLAGERGAKLVKQLLTYSRGGSKEAQETNLNTTVSEVGNLLRGSLPATVAINVHVPATEISYDLDAGQIQQTLVNLALNASEAMGERGVIDIYLEQLEVDGVRCSSCGARFAGGFVRLKMEDTGSGFGGNAHELFTPFATTKPIGHGSGLGLSVVHGIVHEHHGHVQLSNRSQIGARCSIYLPINQRSRTVPVADKKILLIEDDPSVARYLESLFGENGLAVTAVSLPTQALARFMAEPDEFNLVITDQVMPQGSGIELAEDLHELRPELPVIMATANPAAVSEDDMLRAGIKAIFGKPIESELLLAKVRGLLSSHG